MPTHVQPIEMPVASPSVSASKGWASVLLPSLSDLFFLFIVVWLFLADPLGWQRLLKDADTTLHIRVGE